MKKIAVTIGIPAYNEGGNIGLLLDSILRQKHETYLIEKIIVACDGCTDNTVSVVRSYSNRFNNKIIVINDGNRIGKAMRLNQIYKKADTDLLLTLDADVVLATDTEIEKMVQKMNMNKKTVVVGARFIPVPQKSIWGKLSDVSYRSFEDAAMKLKNGNNFYTLVGAASLIRQSLYKSFSYPKGVVSDQNYLYVMATNKNNVGYRVVKNTKIWMRTVSTFHDWRVLGVRSTSSDKESVVSFFGNEILNEYKMPKKILIHSLVKFFVKNPFLTTGSVFMNFYIRMFPLKSTTPANGIWELTVSSKAGILL